MPGDIDVGLTTGGTAAAGSEASTRIADVAADVEAAEVEAATGAADIDPTKPGAVPAVTEDTEIAT